ADTVGGKTSAVGAGVGVGGAVGGGGSGVGFGLGFGVFVGFGVGLGLELGASGGTVVAGIVGAALGGTACAAGGPAVAGGPRVDPGMNPTHSATGSASIAPSKRTVVRGAQPRSAPGTPMYTSSQVPSVERAVTSIDCPALTFAIGVPLS